MRSEITQKRIHDRLGELAERLRHLHKALRGRKKRLEYFLAEEVGDTIARRALTSVQETKAEIDEVYAEMAELRQEQGDLNETGLT